MSFKLFDVKINYIPFGLVRENRYGKYVKLYLFPLFCAYKQAEREVNQTFISCFKRCTPSNMYIQSIQFDCSKKCLWDIRVLSKRILKL